MMREKSRFQTPSSKVPPRPGYEQREVLCYTIEDRETEMPRFSRLQVNDNADADDQAKFKRCGATGDNVSMPTG